ncbi:graves disease carrier -like [Brachionus plicatilis]|uniref:Graves disease carrier-like n=1 Tax=Brachionus plicatilis TaxID=10195 RepID=A0A3M7Q8G3_BRAPC|nr:graves disease carrier -like [Brachionus plicatilis]
MASTDNQNSSVFKHFNWRTFVSGGIAGSVAKTLVAPIDRVKILKQVHSKHYAGFGIFESFHRIYQIEGFLALYKGNGAQMVRIFPYAALQFTSYETFKSLNKKLFNHKSNSVINSLACGSLAGITAVSCTYPLDVVRSRLAFQFKGEHVYKGIVDALVKIYSESKSIKSYYRGYLITIMGMVPYAGISFSSFEHIKKFVLKKHVKYLTHRGDHANLTSGSHSYYELTVVGKLLCGACTGIIAQTITYPVDVVRRHMQLSNMISEANTKMGIKDTFKYVYSKYGVVKGLYRGITLNYLRAVPMVSTSFCFYELSKKFFGLKTGEFVKIS